MEQQNSYHFQVHTFGCKVNTYDTGLLQKKLVAEGHQLKEKSEGPFSAAPRVHILNTCAVTSEATKEAIKQARRLKAREPLSTIVMTGCSAQVDGALLDHLPGVDLVVANSHKAQLSKILDQYFRGQLKEKIFRSNIFQKEDREPGGGKESEHTRTFLKIQDGCNSFCTFCVIPYARGKSRSLTTNELVLRVHEFAESGSQEVVLTGVHIGDYEDQNNGLSDLVRAILTKTAIPRLRLSSLEPIELSQDLLQLFSDYPQRLCRHFHMSIQSANTRVLKAMKRKYSAEDVENSLRMIAEHVPQSFVGMDVIAGFPGETDQEFEDTYLRLTQLPWTRLHVFPYSERPGTKATLLPDSIPPHVRTLRAQRLRELSSDRFRNEAHAQVGSNKQVLFLNQEAKGTTPFVQGLSRDYWPVRVVGLNQKLILNQENWVQITGFDESVRSRMDGFLTAELLKPAERASS
jgi:threonylcarbamoyladenosine tRNA methylthiotransferase MtaB